MAGIFSQWWHRPNKNRVKHAKDTAHALHNHDLHHHSHDHKHDGHHKEAPPSHTKPNITSDTSQNDKRCPMNEYVIKIPTLGESVSEASVARWLKNQGDTVEMDETVMELETDKVTLEITAPAAGILQTINYTKGQTVIAGDIAGIISTVSENAHEPVEIVQPVIQNAQVIIEPIIISQPAAVSRSEETLPILTHPASPAVRKRLADLNIDPASVQSHRPDGRITKEDVEAAANGQPTQPLAQPIEPIMDTPIAPEIPITIPENSELEDRLERRVPMSRLRLRVSERLKDAQNTAAILTTFNEIDMSAVKQLRDKYKDSFEKKHGVKLGFMSFFVKACVQALHEIPMVNSRIEGTEIVTNNYCDIGIAVSSPNGLVVPIIRDADLLDLATIEKEIGQFGKKARDNKLSIEEMTGGTFTISNGGVFGSLMSTPIINPPQSGILGMHKIQDRPVAIDGRVEIRPMMYVALSYDHRLIDGREAVTFLVSIKDSIENPGRFLLGL